MATGDTVISIAVEGGVTKSVTLDSATRVLSRANVARNDEDIDTDAEWQVFEVNKLANVIAAQANSQLQREAAITPTTFTAAT
jgi:CheY-specific phosphatase CheX